jgi:hypothetical protein
VASGPVTDTIPPCGLVFQWIGLLEKTHVGKSVVLAYSGGLDTSVLVGWLQDEGYDVHCLYVDLGQPCEDRDAIMKKARDIGAKSAELVDVREELCRDFAFPVLQWQARYENIYLMGTSIARPLIAKACLQRGREVGAEAFVHGATGKGNDQCRFQLAAEALEPGIRIIAPWRMQKFRDLFPGRTEMLEYCEKKNIPVKATAKKPYSSDENCLHISYEAGDLEDPTVDGTSVIDFGMSVSPQEAPDKEETSRSSLNRACLWPSTVRSSARPSWWKNSTDRWTQWLRSNRHRGKSLCRHEEPRSVRSSWHDAAVCGSSGPGTDDARPRPDSPA